MNLLHNLTGFHRALTYALLRAFPEWRTYAQMVTTAKDIEVKFEIPDSVPGRNKNLIITSSGNEATLSFACWHTHFFAGRVSSEQYFIELVRFIASFQAERVIIWEVLKPDGSCAGIGGHYSLPLSEENHLRYEESQQRVVDGRPILFRSWRGSYDGPNPPQEAIV